MDYILIIEWLATIFSIIGASLVVYKKWQGYVAWIISNILWVLLGLLQENYGLSLTFTFFTVICGLGIYEWKLKRLDTNG